MGQCGEGRGGAGTFTEAESCFKCCLASRSRLKSQTGHQVSKWWDSLQHLGPFKGSGIWKISKRWIKASQTPTDPPEPAIFTSKVSIRRLGVFHGQPLGKPHLFSPHHTPLLLLSAKRYTTLSLLFMSNQMWCQSNLHRDIISFNTSSLNSSWLANSDWVSAQCLLSLYWKVLLFIMLIMYK